MKVKIDRRSFRTIASLMAYDATMLTCVEPLMLAVKARQEFYSKYSRHLCFRDEAKNANTVTAVGFNEEQSHTEVYL